MRRRDFIAAFVGAAATRPCVAHAQQHDRAPKIGVIMNYAEIDSEGKARLSALSDQLSNLGWAEGTNVQIEVRWAAGKADLMLAYASQFVSQPADLIVANSTPLLAVLKREQRRRYYSNCAPKD